MRKLTSLPIYAVWIISNFINWTSQFPFLGLLVCISNFYSNIDTAFCKGAKFDFYGGGGRENYFGPGIFACCISN